MDIPLFYAVVGGCLASYTLGHMHAQEHTHWNNTLMAVIAGVFWPLVLGYAIYSVHFKVSKANP